LPSAECRVPSAECRAVPGAEPDPLERTLRDLVASVRVTGSVVCG